MDFGSQYILNFIATTANKNLFLNLLMAVTTIMGLFYGLTGLFALNVYFDIVLLLLAFYSLYNLIFRFKKDNKAFN
jgi:cation transport ATPase